MSVTSQNIKNTYVSQGERRFEIDFPFGDKEEIQVVALDEKNIIETELTPAIDYNIQKKPVSNGGFLDITDTGFEKTPRGSIITIIRRPPMTQETSLMENDPFYTSTIEKMVDKLTYIAMALKEDINRSVTYPIGLTYKPDYAELTKTVDKAYEAAKDAAEAAQIIEEGKTQVISSAQKAMQWASNPENVPVEDGKYSAYHYAMQVKDANSFASISEALEGTSTSKAMSPSTTKAAVAHFMGPDYSNITDKDWETTHYADKNGFLVCQCVFGKVNTGCVVYVEIATNANLENSFNVINADSLLGSIEHSFFVPVSKGTYYRAGGALTNKNLYFIPVKGE